MKRNRNMNDHKSYPPNPFVAVWPGQDIQEAIEAHIRQTGCQGPFFVEFMDVEAQETRPEAN